MRIIKMPEDASLLNVLIHCFEKNEVLDGTHWRELPMPDEGTAVARFDAFVDEARHWKGEPIRHEVQPPRRLATWPDLELRQCGRGVIVRVRAPWFDWWYAAETWAGAPMGPIHDWLEEDRKLTGGTPFAPEAE